MTGDGKLDAALLGIWATFALDVYSTLNSSPQTTELFADERESSLMFWVRVGSVVAVAGGVAGTIRSGSAYPVVGAVAVTLMMFWFYRLAVKRGQGQDRPSNAD